MKKFILLLGTLLFAAVFMSGCITDTASDDPVVGIWHYGEVFSAPNGLVFDSSHHVFNADGTGFTINRFDGELVSGIFHFTWENAGDGKYLLSVIDNKKTVFPESLEAVLEGDVLNTPLPGYPGICHRESVADYAAGLWTGVRGDYKGYTDIQVLLYLDEDGTGNTVLYGPEVLNMEDVFTAEFTWDVRENNVVLMGENGGSFELPLVEGELVFAGLYPLHKYTLEDNLYNGVWQSVEPVVEDGVAYDIVEVIKHDGTGVEIWTVPGSDAASAQYNFTWKMIDSTTYEAVFDDGEVWEFTAHALQLFDGETWYNKVSFDALTDYAQSKVNA